MSIKSYYNQFADENGAHSYTTVTTKSGKTKKVIDYKVSRSAEAYFDKNKESIVADWRIVHPDSKKRPYQIKEAFIEAVRVTKALNVGLETKDAIRKVRYSRNYMTGEKQMIESTRLTLKQFGIGLNQTRALQYSAELRKSGDGYTGEYISTGKYAGNIVVIVHGANGQSTGLGFVYDPDTLIKLNLM